MRKGGAGGFVIDKPKGSQESLREVIVSERIGGSQRPDGSVFQCEPNETADFFNREGFLNDSSSSEEFGDIQEILVAGSACHGNHSGIKEFLGQRERDLHPVSFRHQDICNDKVGGLFPIKHETDLPILCFTDGMAVIFQDAA